MAELLALAQASSEVLMFVNALIRACNDQGREPTAEEVAEARQKMEAANTRWLQLLPPRN